MPTSHRSLETDGLDQLLRKALFERMDVLVARYGDLVPAAELRVPVSVHDVSVIPLQQVGIFKPKAFGSNGAALVILSTLDGPYNDRHDLETGVIGYRYQGQQGDEDNHFNRSLRRAMELQRPLLYLLETDTHTYMPLYPSYVIADDRARRTVSVVLGMRSFVFDSASSEAEQQSQQAIRAYNTVLTKQRLHQAGFRRIVLKAYRVRCAICNLQLPRLLDAAHIVPDNEPLGDPVVQNGLALCKIHHEAYDSQFIGIDPDYTVHVREDVLRMQDGPMLSHGIQNVHQQKIILPHYRHDRPDPERLEVIWQRFTGQ